MNHSIGIKSPYENVTKPPTISILPAPWEPEIVPVRAAAPCYASQWRELRRRQLRVVCAVAGCLTIGALGVCLLPSIVAKVALILLEVAATAHLARAAQAFACPRCQKAFFQPSREHRPDHVAGECIHCGLARGASESAAPTQSPAHIPMRLSPRVRSADASMSAPSRVAFFVVGSPASRRALDAARQ